jgi:nucleoside diphosphate kinase
MSTMYENFTSWYLRFNGYFTVDNFVVHAADDPTRISDGIIAPHTETDSIAIRMPYSAEIAGKLKIANHDVLVENQNERFDIVIAEAKSGNDNKPNSVWRNKVIATIKYMVRFVGLYGDEHQITKIANELATHYFYEDDKSRIRYIVFANEPNLHYFNEGVKYITFSQIVNFLVEVRGQCWIKSGIGVASVHYQWDEQINKIFEIANDFEKTLEVRESKILEFLVSENKKTG